MATKTPKTVKKFVNEGKRVIRIDSAVFVPGTEIEVKDEKVLAVIAENKFINEVK